MPNNSTDSTAYSNQVAYDPVTDTFYNPVSGVEMDYDEGFTLARHDISEGWMVLGMEDQQVQTTEPTGISAEQNQSNLNAIAALVAAELGLTNLPKSSWTIAQRNAYISNFRTRLLANAGSFTPATVLIAQHINPGVHGLDSNFEADIVGWVESARSVAQPAIDMLTPLAKAPVAVADAARGLIDALAGIGQGLSSTAKILPYLIPIALIAFVFMATRSASSSAYNASVKGYRLFK